MEVKIRTFDASQMFAVQKRQYPDRIYLTDTVAAGATQMGVASVSTVGHFYCSFISGNFTTQDTAGGPVDSGINYLRGLLKDGADNLPLFGDYIPFDLFLTPGRRKSLAAGAAGNPLFFPMELGHLFRAGGSIMLDVKNDSDVANNYRIVFHGVRIRT